MSAHDALRARLPALTDDELAAECLLRIRAYAECRPGSQRHHLHSLAGLTWDECTHRHREDIYKGAVERINRERREARRANDDAFRVLREGGKAS